MLQAVYHGFGITVLQCELVPMSGKPVQTHVLQEPAFLVRVVLYVPSPLCTFTVWHALSVHFQFLL